MRDIKTIGIFKDLEEDEKLEIENPSVSVVNFEKGSFFKKYDTCVGKIYLTDKRIILLKLILLDARNMKVDSIEQFGSALGQWFEVPFEYITSISTPKQGFWRGVFKRLVGEKKEGLEIHYELPMEIEKKKLFGGVKKYKETYIMVFSIDNKELWNMKIQALVVKTRQPNQISENPPLILEQNDDFQPPKQQMPQQDIQPNPPPLKTEENDLSWDEEEMNDEESHNDEKIPKFCPECGSKTEERKFCGECGEKLI